MNILIACEESQAVAKAFRAKGHNAYSCDVQTCSGGHPEWHIYADIDDALFSNYALLQDGNMLTVPKWDMVIAFPPCTHLAVSGARHFATKRADGRQQQGIDFFMKFATLDTIERVAIENPVGIMSTQWRRPDQIIQPWMFGHSETKATCLWLKGLPKLHPTNDVKHTLESLSKKENHKVWYASPGKDRAKIRSKTFEGIAKAMVNQWGV